jgi:hypothetical protein
MTCQLFGNITRIPLFSAFWNRSAHHKYSCEYAHKEYGNRFQFVYSLLKTIVFGDALSLLRDAFWLVYNWVYYIYTDSGYIPYNDTYLRQPIPPNKYRYLAVFRRRQ